MRRAANLVDLAREGGPTADDRCREAIAEYAAASNLAPRNSAALYGWAVALIDFARIKGAGREAGELIDEAQEKLSEASALGSRDASNELLDIETWRQDTARP